MENTNNLEVNNYKSIRDKVEIIRRVYSFLLKKWIIIFIVGFLGAGIGIAIAWITKPKYVAKLTFSVENEKSNPLGAYYGLAAITGVDITGSGGGMFSSDNITTILISRNMVVKTLLSPIVIEDKAIPLVEYYLNFNHISDKWKNSPKLANLKFELNQDFKTLSREQDSILWEIHNYFVKNTLVVSKPDKKLNLVETTFSSNNERFSKTFLETLHSQVTNFYVSIKTRRQKANVDLLQSKADSLYKILSSSIDKGAILVDNDLNLAKQVAGTDRQKNQIDLQIVSSVYAEVIRNLEIAKITLQRETPLIQIIDLPLYPLQKIKLSRLKGMLIGGILSGFLTILFLLGQNYFSKVMKNE